MIRKPFVSGQFYPSDKIELEKDIKEYLNLAKIPEIKDKIIGIISPHAGYVYSGKVAAHSYKIIKDLEINTIILLGPSHHASFQGFALYEKGSWQTPLGEVPIDEEIAKELKSRCAYIKDLKEAHNYEHSLEVQIPFLQVIYKDFKIVPIMVLFPTYEECESLAKAISEVIQTSKKKIIFLISSDLYHGYSYKECVETDKRTLSYIEKLEPKTFYQGLLKEEISACGGFPILIGILIAKNLSPKAKAVVLNYTNSNDVIGAKTGYCVGYSSVVFTIPQEEKEKNLEEEFELKLSEEEKKELLTIARKTLESYLHNKKIPDFKITSENLKKRYGVFVTLEKFGELRGCIGYVEGIKPLYEGVIDNAINAALRDPRFPPVSSKELKDIKIEITVLSPLKKIEDINKIVVGKHGILIKKGFYQGLLLPQVATEYGWDRETFLKHTCLKAGLNPESYKDKDTEIYIFEGLIISEE
ncbi:MAG: AmmeMemoRadiSam system protein B [candidate division WOR-3 bacterium]|nr:AmmeMemoRadiSam system protein B [candidate division WOR-3 bacterium]MDW8114015.1 AmmeMemoRadiSam system protein B [candidate division WOR-3 bacterium]